MSEVMEYKCPCCGGAIAFDSHIQKMKCPYCDTEFEMDTLKEFEQENMEQDHDPQWDASRTEQDGEQIGGAPKRPLPVRLWRIPPSVCWSPYPPC